PFRVVGILERTFTPVDRSLYVTLQGVDAMHEGFMETPGAGPGGPPSFAPPPNFAAPPDFSAPSGGAGQSNDTVGTEPTSSVAAGESNAAATHDAPPEQITAFFLGARTRIATLQLQREINTYEAEATMA